MARGLADVGRRGCLWRFKGRITALALAVVLTANWGWQTLRDRDLEIAAAETRVTDMARAAEYQVDGSVRSIAALMAEAADRIDPARWPDPALQQWFSARLAGFPEIRNMALTDAQGRVVGTIARPGQVLPGWSEDLSDREYYTNSRKQFPDRRFYVPKPVVSRFSQKASIPLVQVIVGRHGEFAGMVVAGVDPAVFRDQMNAVLIEAAGGASLIRSDGTFLGRVPNHDQFLGQSVAASPLFREHLARASNGVARFISVADGNEKIVAFRTLPNYPLVVTVGITMNTALARWHSQAIVEGTVLVVVILSLVGLAWLYDLRAAATRHLTQELAAHRDMLEQQVAERTAHLAASNAELEQFAYVASHDLQEPLRTISGFLQLLARRYHGKLDAEADEFIDFAVSGAKRMGVLINDLLAFSRVGRNECEDEPCDAEALAQGAASSLGSAVAECGATITTGSLPKVWCRPAELQSVFQNLLGNAVKYRDETRAPMVTVSAVMDGNMVRFAVADNGIGIEPQYHERIFGLFQRLHPRDRFEGTGIGLALCRKIVDHHGGRIWVESVPGQGTTMLFTLRAAPVSNQA